MIARSYIFANLRILDRMYKAETTQKKALFFSKLAILELCGWIEESMDDIILRCATRHLKESDNLKFVRKQIVGKNYGFEYDRHFRKMLIQLLGVVNVEKIEKCVDQNKKTQLIITLSGLKGVRNPEAHTHIKGVTRHINAPSVTLNQFKDLYEGLIDFESTIKASKF